VNIALLALHVVVGVLFAGHGAQKLFGSFGGHGLEGTAGFFENVGLRPGWLTARMAGASEFVGGVLIAFGLLTPIAAALLIATMVAAVATVHFKNGPWVTEQGYEYNLVLILALFVMAATDAGRYSLDHAFGLAMGNTAWGLAALAAGIVGGFGAVAFGRMGARQERRAAGRGGRPIAGH